MDRTKNRDIGFVPMTEPVHETMKDRQLMAPSSTVFDPTLFAAPHRRLARLCKKAGVKVIRFHDLRHSFASIRVMEGVPLHTVGRLLRQRSTQSTMIYAHLSPEYLRTEIEKGCARFVRDSPTSVDNLSVIIR